LAQGFEGQNKGVNMLVFVAIIWEVKKRWFSQKPVIKEFSAYAIGNSGNWKINWSGGSQEWLKSAIERVCEAENSILLFTSGRQFLKDADVTYASGFVVEAFENAKGNLSEKIEKAANVWEREREQRLMRLMRAVQGFTTKDLVSLIQLRAAEWTANAIRSFLGTAEIKMYEDKAVIEVPLEDYDFFLGFGVRQSEQHMDFCRKSTEGFWQQLMSIGR
jgi:hypothetical protein